MTDSQAQTPAPEPTAAEARQELTRMANDRDTAGKLLNGDPETNRDFQRLSEIAAGLSAADRTEAAIGGVLKSQAWETLTGDQLASRDLMAGIDGLRESGVGDDVIRQALKRVPINQQDLSFVRQYQRDRLTNAEFVRQLLSGDALAQREMLLVAAHLSRPVREK